MTEQEIKKCLENYLIQTQEQMDSTLIISKNIHIDSELKRKDKGSTNVSAFSNNSQYLASVGDNLCKIWDLNLFFDSNNQ